MLLLTECITHDDFMFCDKEMVDELFPQAELFIKSVDELLKE